MNDSVDRFLDKLSAFAADLDAEEQAMLHCLLADDDDVAGYAMTDGSRGAVVSGPIPLPLADLRPRLDRWTTFTAPGDVAG